MFGWVSTKSAVWCPFQVRIRASRSVRLFGSRQGREYAVMLLQMSELFFGAGTLLAGTFPIRNWRTSLEQSFTVCMPLLMQGMRICITEKIPAEFS